jgi:predicted ribosomally synthesized peptide with SipW-like signal peptide
MCRIQILVLIGFMGLAGISHTYASFNDDEKETYTSLSSQSYYATSTQILDYLEDLNLGEEALDYGKRGILIMFDECFPKPMHSVKTVNNGWKCLFERLRGASSTPEQIGEFNKTFKLHRNRIKELDPQFGEDILEMFCEKCKVQAYHENGLKTED